MKHFMTICRKGNSMKNHSIKKCIAIVVTLIVCIILFCSCGSTANLGSESENAHNHTKETYTFERDLAYLYYENIPITNNFGGVIRNENHLMFGVVNPYGTVDNNDDNTNVYGYYDAHTLNVSDRSYVKYTATRIVCDICGSFNDTIVDYDFYLSNEMMSQIGNKGE